MQELGNGVVMFLDTKENDMVTFSIATVFRRARTGLPMGNGEARTENRDWEDGYRARWQTRSCARRTV